jgi:DNA polymerase elongation subunit (family B)
MKKIILDVETYQNFFLINVENYLTKKRHSMILTNGVFSLDNKKLIKHILTECEIITFNGSNYDLPMLSGAFHNYDNQRLKVLSDLLISDNVRVWDVLKDQQLALPANMANIDLMAIAPGKASLKLYGARINAKKLQDLPFEPSQILTEQEMTEVIRYCWNDIELTRGLHDELIQEIELRHSINTEYGINVLAKSDPQIAESIIENRLNYPSVKRSNMKGVSFNLQLKEMKSPLYEKLSKEIFKVNEYGKPEFPEWLKKEKIVIGKSQYKFGLGGLHSMEKNQIVDNKPMCISDIDVTSFYPEIICRDKLIPLGLNGDFINEFIDIKNTRVQAKREKKTIIANSLKIVLNGTFGKFGSPYSIFYSPQNLIHVTITGQLALLALIEAMEANGIEVVSANTDGIVCLYPEKLRGVFLDLQGEWMQSQKFNLEETQYQKVVSRDVNNYIAVKLNGDVKRKGCFATRNLQKNPDRQVIYDAVCEYAINGTPVSDHIINETNPFKFVKVRTVSGGSMYGNEYAGKVTRYYHSTKSDKCLTYKKNGNKVPLSQNCKPLLDVDGLPDDIDYQVYIDEAMKILKSMKRREYGV